MYFSRSCDLLLIVSETKLEKLNERGKGNVYLEKIDFLIAIKLYNGRKIWLMANLDKIARGKVVMHIGSSKIVVKLTVKAVTFNKDVVLFLVIVIRELRLTYRFSSVLLPRWAKVATLKYCPWLDVNFALLHLVFPRLI